jgi:SagB-type dehydrogenase family enzyme
MKDQIGPQFMRLTCHENLPLSPQKQGLPMPPYELPLENSRELISLPNIQDWSAPVLDVFQAIEQRRSIRRYASTPLTLAEVGYLLWCTQGIQKLTNIPRTLRTVPSAGARHALETILMINHVEELQPGLMRYVASQHALLPLFQNPQAAVQLTDLCNHQEFVAQSALTFLWIAVVDRMTWRSGARGYRYLHLDAGHACQNLYLAAEPIHCGVCAIMSFDDTRLNAWLHLDGENQFVVYAASVGKKAELNL